MFGFEYVTAAVLAGPPAAAGPEQWVAQRRGCLGLCTFGKDPGAKGALVTGRSRGGDRRRQTPEDHLRPGGEDTGSTEDRRGTVRDENGPR